MYQWKLLNHVSRDHNMTLKPAHLSYKCTVCTATFGMYKQFENHVYSAHSTVAKKAMDNKKAPGPGSSKSGDSLLKPLKINDEITIIPQPASRHSQKNMEIESHVIGKLIENYIRLGSRPFCMFLRQFGNLSEELYTSKSHSQLQFSIDNIRSKRLQ